MVEKKVARLKAVTGNAAMEALQMDISNLCPVRATKRKGTLPKGPVKISALPLPKKKDPTFASGKPWGPRLYP